MHTPRLCIDTRARTSLGGLVAEEVVNSLVSANGEEGASSEWLEKSRTVLLSHPHQIFSGQLKKHQTKMGIGRSPWHLLWERHFEKTAAISAIHRFRPVDRLTSTQCPTITTVLSPKKGLPLFVSRRRNHHYIVPSEADAKILEKNYRVAKDQVTLLNPGPRRYVYFTDPVPYPEEGGILLVGDGKKNMEKLQHVLSLRYRHFSLKIISPEKKNAFSPALWTKHLSTAKICLYLISDPFDWATLALESIYFKVPTIFSDENSALGELLPHSSLKLSRFLIDQPELSQLREMTQGACSDLDEKGIFDPLATARQYRDVYEKL
jgi:hypothetical protein